MQYGGKHRTWTLCSTDNGPGPIHWNSQCSQSSASGVEGIFTSLPPTTLLSCANDGSGLCVYHVHPPAFDTLGARVLFDKCSDWNQNKAMPYHSLKVLARIRIRNAFGPCAARMRTSSFCFPQLARCNKVITEPRHATLSIHRINAANYRYAKWSGWKRWAPVHAHTFRSIAHSLFDSFIIYELRWKVGELSPTPVQVFRVHAGMIQFNCSADWLYGGFPVRQIRCALFACRILIHTKNEYS